jgi:hypothetical protein
MWNMFILWPECKAPFYIFISNPVSDPDTNPDTKFLFRFRIGSGSGQKFRVLPDPDPQNWLKAAFPEFRDFAMNKVRNKFAGFGYESISKRSANPDPYQKVYLSEA